MTTTSLLEAPPQSRWRALLATFFDAHSAPATGASGLAPPWDDLVRVGHVAYAVEFRGRSDTAAVASALLQIESRRANLPPGVIPLLVVPYMGETGMRICASAGQAWLDLAGNAQIVVPGARIVVRGNGAPPTPRGRPSNVFAAKSARVAHYLLLNRSRSVRQLEIARETGLGKGFVSRVIAGMRERSLVEARGEGVAVRDARTLLVAWREAFQPAPGYFLKGVIPAVAPQEAMKKLAAALGATAEAHVFGGLSAAWCYDHFAQFRLVTCHARGPVELRTLREMLGFTVVQTGANVWLMLHADARGLPWLGTREVDGFTVTSPYYTYAELSAHPERAQEAAEHLALTQWGWDMSDVR